MERSPWTLEFDLVIDQETGSILHDEHGRPVTHNVYMVNAVTGEVR